MTGFGIDPVALEAAIKKLEATRDRVNAITGNATSLSPGELTAGDPVTKVAREALQKRATGETGSLTVLSRELVHMLEQKIDGYKATLAEYHEADEAAADEARRLDRQA